jgi:protein-S-isoprenylcysteine O-methyltransferase Ste14
MKEGLDKRLFLRYAGRELGGVVVMGVALFWSAGRLDWLAAWAALAVMAAWIIGTAIIIVRINPSLVAERLGPRKGTKSWDITILGLLGVTQLVRYIIAGLDQRFGWPGEFTLMAQFIAFLLCSLGYALVLWATARNAFFSQIVRIQPERGHKVVTDGPYHYVRHPGYAGAILYELAVAVLLDSWWALIPGGINAILLFLRTALEDRTLQAALAGYKEYARQVRYRLLPGVW